MLNDTCYTILICGNTILILLIFIGYTCRRILRDSSDAMCIAASRPVPKPGHTARLITVNPLAYVAHTVSKAGFVVSIRARHPARSIRLLPAQWRPS